MDLNELYNGILKDSRAFEQLKADFSFGRQGHAYIVVSEDSEAVKRLLPLAVAAAFCLEHGCFECDECMRVLHGNNPDVYFVNYAGDRINKDKIAEITGEANLKSFSGGKRFFLIFRADLMNETAQNKLLKTLEEPPPEVTFILGAATDSLLLPTIKSRVRKLYLDSFPEDVLATALRNNGIGESRALLAAACSSGHITRALEIALNENFNAAHLKALRVLNSLRRPGDVAEFIFDKGFTADTGEFLNALAVLMRDIMLYDTGKELIALKSDMQDIARLSKLYTPDACAIVLRAVNTAKEKLFFNVSAAAVLEILFFEIVKRRRTA
ncbi:MAG: hypothetical protein LBT55_06195 [Clostridiaceae bacterium]|nr:hypothetical protein [Clostridiaceae bacterium]